MSLIQHLVSPKLPTALATYAHVELPGHDIWFIYVCFVPMIFPVLMPGSDQQRSCPADRT
jgi:hypothetical protein